MLILLIGLVFSLFGPTTANANNQFVCKAPTETTNLCANSYGFTPVTEPSLDLGISNPINIATGEKLLKEIDLAENNSVIPPFIRFYKSNNSAQNGFGIAWLNSYSITAQNLKQNTWQISFPDGNKYISQDMQQKGSELHWSINQYRKFIFDTQGKLISLLSPEHGLIKLDYYQDHPFKGYLKKISNKTNHLVLNYQIINKTILLDNIQSPLGQFKYEYINGHLSKVQRPDGMARQYHYESNYQSGYQHLITGISLLDQNAKQLRIRNWQYDKQARVIKAWPNNIKQALSFSYKTNQTNIKSASTTSNTRFQRILNNSKITQQTISGNGFASSTIIKYDQNGRLKQIGDLVIERYPNGQIYKLRSKSSQLILKYMQSGQLDTWFSPLTNITKIFYHQNGELQGMSYANDDRLDISPDNFKRPIKLTYTSKSSKPTQVQLAWRGQNLIKLENEFETEFLRYDEHSNQRTVVRKLEQRLKYTESFKYDKHGQIIEHHLPEGGLLKYQRSGKRILNIQWFDINGKSQHIIQTQENTAGYTYGNLLQTQALFSKNSSSLIHSSNKSDMVWGEFRLNDSQSKLIKQLIFNPRQNTANEFAYDRLNRLVAYQSSQSDTSPKLFKWSADGLLEASKANNQTTKPNIKRDPSGLAIKIDEFDLKYNSQRRLATVSLNNKIIAKYFYNSRGHRIFQEYPNTQSAYTNAHRLYVNNKLAAIWYANQIKQRFIYAHNTVVGLIQTDKNNQSQLYFVHNNNLGAPVLVTDKQQNIVWQADYDVFGFAHLQMSDINMPIRLPGQDADPITNWHENVFRTYLPKLGHYLEPDPLGPIPEQQIFGYAKQQPLRYTDTLGLILLAFDGTRYSPSNQSNIWKLSQIYNDGPSFYHQGPGSSYYLNWDAVTAASSRQIQENQWQSLMNELDIAQGQNLTIPIDILGYSRGAALARDFANRISANTKNGWFSYDDPLRGNIGICINLRFLGLFDTVAQFGLLGAANAGYDLGINSAWQWVAHAVASHELRYLFPLVTTADNLNYNLNTIEVPFIGAHADIGGGMVLDDDLQPMINGDLSDVALNWMYWQANAALVKQADLDKSDTTVSQAWLHDERSIIEKSLLDGDRNIQDANTNNIGPQGASPTIGDAQRQVFEHFIDRVNQYPELKVTGIVNMHEYNLWLQHSLGMPSMLY